MPENYFVYGEEEYMVQAKVRELKAKFGDPEAWNLERLESWADLQDRLLTQSMFAESRLFICRYQVFERDKPDLGQAEQILSGHANVLIIYANSKPDKRTNIFKLITRVSTVCEVQAPKGHELQRWLQKRAVELGGELEREAAVELIYLAGTDMLSLENELIKLINYDKKITPANVRVLATPPGASAVARWTRWFRAAQPTMLWWKNCTDGGRRNRTCCTCWPGSTDCSFGSCFTKRGGTAAPKSKRSCPCILTPSRSSMPKQAVSPSGNAPGACSTWPRQTICSKRDRVRACPCSKLWWPSWQKNNPDYRAGFIFTILQPVWTCAGLLYSYG